MKSKEEIKKWLLENCVDEYGNLYLSDIDLSDFNGNVYINDWKVKKSLSQGWHKVGGHLSQGWQTVGGNLYQYIHKRVDGSLYQQQYSKNIKGDILQKNYKDREYNERLKCWEKPKKKYTYEELKEKLGHDFKIVEDHTIRRKI